MAAGAGPEPGDPHGRLCLDVLHAGAGHWCAGGAICALLHVAERPGAALFCLFSGVHGLDDGHRAVGQHHPAGFFLGTDQSFFVSLDWLLAPPKRCAARCAHGADGNRHGRAVHAGRHAGDRPHRRQLRPGRGAGGGRADSRASAVPDCPGAGAAGRADQKRAVSVSFLAAARDGRTHAGIKLSAFGHDGQGGRVFAGAPVAGAGRHRTVVLAGGRRGVDHAADWRLCGDVPE